MNERLMGSSNRIEVALAIIRRKGRWLVTRRSPRRPFAGYWEFPGGKIEPGESPADAAIREVFEETGLPAEPRGVIGHVDTEHGHQCVRLHLVRCQVHREDAAGNDPAIQEVRWVTWSQLQGLAMPPANARILELLRHHGS